MAVPAVAGVLARLAPMIARVGSSTMGKAATRGAVTGIERGVAGRVANMVQGQKDGNNQQQPPQQPSYPNFV